MDLDMRVGEGAEQSAKYTGISASSAGTSSASR
jgi:hypothetical protein